MAKPKCDRIAKTRYQFKGFMEDYLEGITRNWLLSAPQANPAMLEMLRDRDATPLRALVCFAGEFPGKYLTAAVIPDLIEVGLDCMESCQPECMDVYDLKRRYGRDIRFWGGLGAQSVLPFGSADEVRGEIRRLKREMGKGGGYIFASAKGPDENVPVENIAACLEEANGPRG